MHQAANLLEQLSNQPDLLHPFLHKTYCGDSCVWVGALARLVARYVKEEDR